MITLIVGGTFLLIVAISLTLFLLRSERDNRIWQQKLSASNVDNENIVSSELRSSSPIKSDQKVEDFVILNRGETPTGNVPPVYKPLDLGVSSTIRQKRRNSFA